jgi:hypothetical protein
MVVRNASVWLHGQIARTLLSTARLSWFQHGQRNAGRARIDFSSTRCSSGFKGAEADPNVSSAMNFPEMPAELQSSSLPDTGGAEGKAVREEVARVMAQPEINGQPVALDFSSKGKTKG